MTQRTLVLLVLARVATLAQSTPPITKGLTLAVLQGDGVVHELPSPPESRVSIRISDANGTPIPKATAVFEFPEIGPSAVVATDGSTVKVLLTDDEGAASVVIRSNGVPGHFEPKVTVNYLGQTATAPLKQENAFAPGLRPDEYRKYSQKALLPKRSRKWLYVLGIAGGAAAGIILATQGAASSTPAPTPGGGIVITPGTGSVGGR